MKERRKEGGRKEVKEVKEKEKRFPLKRRVPQCFSEKNWHLCFEVDHPGRLLGANTNFS